MDRYEDALKLSTKWGKYQLLLSIIVILSSFFCPMILIMLPMMGKVPKFKFNNMEPDESFCKTIYYTESFNNIYDKIEINPNSVINWSSELKYVCFTKEIFSLVGTVFFIASIIANLSYSKIPDRYGRRRIYLLLNFFSLLSIIQLLYLKHLTQLIIASFILGISSINLSIGSIYINETIENKYSGLIIGITCSMFPLGGIIHTLVIYYLKDWRYYLIFIIIVCLITNVIGIKFLQESPRWLLANHKYDAFNQTVDYISKMNKIYIQNEVINLKYDITNNNYRKIVYSFMDLFKYKSIRLMTLKNILLWIISGFSFFGILLNLEGLTGNIYTDAFITYSAEFIAEIMSGISASKLGRRLSSMISYFLAGLGCFLFVYFDLSFFKYIVLFISAIGVASGFNLLYIYSPELFPTNIKSLAISILSLFNRMAGGSIPILLDFNLNITVFISYISFAAVFIVISLPESLDYNAGDEIEELKEKFYHRSNLNRLISI